MNVIIPGFKKAVSIIWEESILLIGLNVIIFLAIVPALLFFNLSSEFVSVFTSIINTLLFFPVVFFLFPLFYLLYDVASGNAVKIKGYFHYMRLTWKLALRWGGINLIIFLLVTWNLRFYAQFEAQWAGIMQLSFLSILLIWIVLQCLMLPIYPRMKTPGYKLALQNAMSILGQYLPAVIILVSLLAVLLIASISFQVLPLFFTFVVTGALLEGYVGEIIRTETGQEDDPHDSQETGS